MDCESIADAVARGGDLLWDGTFFFFFEQNSGTEPGCVGLEGSRWQQCHGPSWPMEDRPGASSHQLASL